MKRMFLAAMSCCMFVALAKAQSPQVSVEVENGVGLIQAYDATTSSFLPLSLKGRTLINGAADNANYSLLVNGPAFFNKRIVISSAIEGNDIFRYGSHIEFQNSRFTGGMAMTIGQNNSGAIQAYSSAAQDGYLLLNPNGGNVGIGTANPKYKLAVKGTILAEKVKVSVLASEWPDFVFSDSYQLPSLQYVETYIREHQHLPNVPSAIEAQQNGQDLAETNRILLQKVEELTLYIIQQQKQMAVMDARLKAVEKQ